jgi:hypothetical protein
MDEEDSNDQAKTVTSKSHDSHLERNEVTTPDGFWQPAGAEA